MKKLLKHTVTLVKISKIKKTPLKFPNVSVETTFFRGSLKKVVVSTELLGNFKCVF